MFESFLIFYQNMAYKTEKACYISIENKCEVIMNKKTICTEKRIKDLAAWMKRSVDTLMNTEYTCCRFGVDSDDIAIFAGWIGGFDKDDNYYQDIEGDTVWTIEIGIKGREFMETDYEWLNSPWEPEFGEVIECYINPTKSFTDDDYLRYAKGLLEDFVDTQNGLNEGKLVLE